MTIDYPYDPKAIVAGAFGSEDDFCMGYLNPGASGNGYISTLKLSVGWVEVGSPPRLDKGTEGIVSYDRCEKNDAYIGQINMLTASSFCGLNGAIWGYDLVKSNELKNGGKPFDEVMQHIDKNLLGDANVVHVNPLLDATKSLYGSIGEVGGTFLDGRRFCPLPGAHVVCANKNKTTPFTPGVSNKVWVWSAIALAILKDRNIGSSLFIEDTDIYSGDDVDAVMIDTLVKIVQSVLLCGQDQLVEYETIFVGFKAAQLDTSKYVGCSLTCAPYVTLAKNVIPPGYKASDLVTNLDVNNINGWESKLKLQPLPPDPSIPPDIKVITSWS